MTLSEYIEKKEKAIATLETMKYELSNQVASKYCQAKYEATEMAFKALEQPSDDVMVIHTQGLDEGIRCAMCTNSMKSDRGCDGGCVVNEDMYKKVMDTIKNCMSTVEERKVGKWIEVWESQRDEFSGEYDEWREHKCSICDFQEMDADRFNFCPNCGTEMRGSENE